MEEFLKGFELVRSAWEYLKDKPVLKVTVNIFAVSSAVFAFCSVPMVSSILGSMNETIRGLAFIALMLSGLSLCSTYLVEWIYEIADRRRAEKIRERERLQRESDAEKEREKLIAEIKSLSGMESRILELVQTGQGCGVWVPLEDAAVQTLIHKGLLKPVCNIGTWQDCEGSIDGRALCILVEIPSAVKSVLRK